MGLCEELAMTNLGEGGRLWSRRREERMSWVRYLRVANLARIALHVAPLHLFSDLRLVVHVVLVVARVQLELLVLESANGRGDL